MEAIGAELFSGCVGGFEEAVGVEEETVSGLDGVGRGFVGGEREGGKHESVFGDGDDFSVAEEEHGRVGGGGVAEGGSCGVEIDVGGGDELALGVSVEDGIHAGEERGRVGSVGSLGGGGEFDHGGDERCGDSVAGDVGDEEAGLFWVGDEEVVEVSGDGGHGDVAGGYLEVIGGGIGGWEDVSLDAAGDLEFLLNLAELGIAGQTSFCGYVAEGGEEEGEAYGFDIVKSPQGAGYVVVEDEGAEYESGSANDDGVAIGSL